jgi:hypothetical protein
VVRGLQDAVAPHLAQHVPGCLQGGVDILGGVGAGDTAATTIVLAALGRTGSYLRNLDGRAEFSVRQIFLTSLPVHPSDGLSTYGIRNDLLVDISEAVGRKVGRLPPPG